MKLPVNTKDVKSVIDAAVGLTGAELQSVSVSVYLDDTAPADAVAHVRAAFASASAQARVTIDYLGRGRVAAGPYDDFAVVVAGLREDVGQAAAALRSDGIPVMVATTLPLLVAAIAQDAGFPIPEGDIVSPAVAGLATAASASEASRGFATARRIAEDARGGRVGGVVDAAAANGENLTDSVDAAFAAEPYVLDEGAARLLDQRMGEWIIETTGDKRLAMARAFPFVRRPLALDAVNVTAVQNAGIGLVPFLPGADFPVMTVNQAKMILQIAAAYGEPMTVERAKEMVGVVGGAFVLRSVARSLVKVVPVIGWAIRAAVGYAGTAAMGRAAIEYFERGGGVAGLAGTVAAAGEAAVRFATEASGQAAKRSSQMTPEEAFDAACAWIDRAGTVAGKVVEVAGPVVARAASAGAASFAAGASSIARSAGDALKQRSSAVE